MATPSATPATAMDPLTGQQTPLSPIQEWAQKEETQANQPGLAAMYKFQHQYQPQNSMGYRLGSWIRNKAVQGKTGVGQKLDGGTFPGFLMGALPGAAALGLGSAAAGKLTNSDTNPWLWALLGGLGLGAVGAYSGYKRTHTPMTPLISDPAATKSAGLFKMDADPRQPIFAALQNAPGMSFSERSRLMTGIGQLTDWDARELQHMLVAVGGAGVGAVIARFLMGKGLASTVLGAVFGGVAANALFNQPARNSAGLLSLGNKDWYGNPI